MTKEKPLIYDDPGAKLRMLKDQERHKSANSEIGFEPDGLAELPKKDENIQDRIAEADDAEL